MEEKSIGFKRVKGNKKKIFDYILNINFFYFIILTGFYMFFLVGNSISRIALSDNKITAISQNLKRLAIIAWSNDRELADTMLTADKILSNYTEDKNIIKENKQDLIKVTEYLQKNIDKTRLLGLQDYQDFIDLIGKMLDYKQDIFSLLGEKNPQNYLVILQNTAEKRPGGGFFGSYGLLNIDGTKWNIKIEDSYYPEFAGSGTYIYGPDFLRQIGIDNKINFVGANKYGFSDIDGQNIKTLYEKIFPDQNIRGIIFINTDLIKSALPDFRNKLREWQFVNSSIDLIRGSDQPYKKENYINEINQYINQNKSLIVKNILKNINNNIKEGNIRFYIENISDGLNSFINTNNLSNIYSDNNIYLWDNNISNNKIDEFVDKTSQIIDSEGNIITETSKDIINISGLKKGDYNLRIYYGLNVPISYQNFIKDLEKTYKISIGDSQKHVLGLDHFWDNRGVIYMPSGFVINKISGQVYSQRNIKTNIANNIVYKINIDKNNDIKYIEISFRKN